MHDVSSVNKNLPLSEGMIITVEPGLYLRDGLDVPARLVYLRKSRTKDASVKSKQRVVSLLRKGNYSVIFVF